MTSTFTPNKNLEKPANGDDVGTWDLPVNADWDAIDASLGGLTTLNVTSASGTVNLTFTQCRPPIIELTGPLTANVTYAFPSGAGGFWFVKNGTTGSFTVSFASLTGGGSTISVAQGVTTPIICDGTNVAPLSTVPAVAAGSTGQVQFNSGGALAASANITTDGTNFGVSGNLLVGGNLQLAGPVASSLNIEANAQTPSVPVVFSATAMVVNCASSNVFSTVFTANVTTAPALSSPGDGQTINWFITQDGTGGRTMTWPTSFKWPGGSVGVLSTAANAVDLLVATYRSATGNWYASLAKNFS